jgi:hypothetical protein
MGEENRESSGGGTTMIVVAILGGILAVGCCGGVVTLGLGGLLWSRAEPMNLRMQPPMAAPVAVEVAPEVSKALEELNKDLEPLKIEPGGENPEVVPPPGSEASGIEAIPAAPAPEEKIDSPGQQGA